MFAKKILLGLVAGLLLYSGLFINGVLLPVQAQDETAPLTQVVQFSDGAASFILPAEWMVIDETGTDRFFFFGENREEANKRRGFWRDNVNQNLEGNGGLIGIYANTGLRGYNPALNAVENSIAFFKQTDMTIVELPQPVKIKNRLAAYSVGDWATSRGYFALIPLDNEVVFVYLTTSAENFDVQRALFFAILQSVSAPASPVGMVMSPQGGAFSITLPAAWRFADLIRINGVLVFAESRAEVENRRVFALSDEDQPVRGSGGVVWFYEQNAPEGVRNDVPVEANLDSFITAKGITALEAVRGIDLQGQRAALTVVEWSAQRGILALVQLDGRWVVVFAGGAMNAFETSAPLLLDIVNSLRVPGIAGLGDLAVAPPPLPAARNEANNVRITLPEGWASRSLIDNNGVQTVYFAADESEIDRMVNSGNTPAVAGGAVILGNQPNSGRSIQELFAANAPDASLQQGIIQTGTLDGYAAMWVEFRGEGVQGYWVVIDTRDRVVLLVLRTTATDWKASREVLESIFRSFRYNASGL